MSRLKIAIILLLAAIIVVAGALLPMVVGEYLNAQGKNVMQTAPVSNLELKFGEDVSVRERLCAFAKSEYFYEIHSRDANLTYLDLKQIVEQQVQDMEIAGLVEDELDTVDFGATLQLCYTPLRPDDSYLMWFVEVSGKNSFLMLFIDDQTGRVFRMDYDLYVAEEWDNQKQDKHLQALQQVYLMGLGSRFREEFVRFEGLTEETQYNDYYFETVVRWEDPEFGTMTIAFMISQYSYHISLS